MILNVGRSYERLPELQNRTQERLRQWLFVCFSGVFTTVKKKENLTKIKMIPYFAFSPCPLFIIDFWSAALHLQLLISSQMFYIFLSFFFFLRTCMWWGSTFMDMFCTLNQKEQITTRWTLIYIINNPPVFGVTAGHLNRCSSQPMCCSESPSSLWKEGAGSRGFPFKEKNGGCIIMTQSGEEMTNSCIFYCK